ncbi:MAG: hypothetical protein FXF47_01420 [Candidatus Mcinerneyibacterium aminivorans]|jgi:hypothetical protein|uniref:Uncharacterized protein n=1 Tax=Candidatus Mcinerneyibacterium aminivorans TaxID=2703815 RepID=A0A5D0MK43_9BACT|nr:MAG: hypothetical protein FXF47_01420 [Candidatus Mcinerneyibacterium aminivorans]
MAIYPFKVEISDNGYFEYYSPEGKEKKDYIINQKGHVLIFKDSYPEAIKSVYTQEELEEFYRAQNNLKEA